jgi:hypothetical protein
MCFPMMKSSERYGSSSASVKSQEFVASAILRRGEPACSSCPSTWIERAEVTNRFTPNGEGMPT